MDDGSAGSMGVSRLPEETPVEVRKHLAAAEAALMLVESLMYALIENRVLTSQQVIEAVETVIETKRQFVADGSHPGISTIAAGMVTTVANSLAAMVETDVPAVAEASVPAVPDAGVPVAAGASSDRSSEEGRAQG